MRFHKIDCRGRFWVHRVTDISLHPHSGDDTDEGRLVFDEAQGELYLGGPTSWQKLIVDPIYDNTTTLGTSGTRFKEIHAVTFYGTATAAKYS